MGLNRKRKQKQRKAAQQYTDGDFDDSWALSQRFSFPTESTPYLESDFLRTAKTAKMRERHTL